MADKSFYVFIGGDEERLKRVIEELTETSSAKWLGKLPLLDILDMYGSEVYALYFNMDLFVATGVPRHGVEVTPEEFIKRITESYPKDFQKRLEEFLEEGCAYSGFIERYDGRVLEGTMIYGNGTLESYTDLMYLEDITKCEIKKLQVSDYTFKGED